MLRADLSNRVAFEAMFTIAASAWNSMELEQHWQKLIIMFSGKTV